MGDFDSLSHTMIYSPSKRTGILFQDVGIFIVFFRGVSSTETGEDEWTHMSGQRNEAFYIPELCWEKQTSAEIKSLTILIMAFNSREKGRRLNERKAAASALFSLWRS